MRKHRLNTTTGNSNRDQPQSQQSVQIPSTTSLADQSMGLYLPSPSISYAIARAPAQDMEQVRADPTQDDRFPLGI